MTSSLEGILLVNRMRHYTIILQEEEEGSLCVDDGRVGFV